MTDEAQGSALTVTLKGGGDFNAPWIVVRADDPNELEKYLAAVKERLTTAVTDAARAFHAIWNVTDGLGASSVQPAPQPAAPASPWDSAPAQQPAASPPPASPAPPSGERDVDGEDGVEMNKYGNTYEWAHPKAPMTPAGQAVLKRATSRAGKPYARWIDPRSKEIPSVYKAGARQDPPDLWPGDFANGV